MIERPTWWRWVAGLTAALLIAMVGANAAAASIVCADEGAAVTPASSVAAVVVAAEPSDDEACPEGCLACAHCQSHHTAAGLMVTTAAVAEPFASSARLDLPPSAPLRSHDAHRLKRPPRA